MLSNRSWRAPLPERRGDAGELIDDPGASGRSLQKIKLDDSNLIAVGHSEALPDRFYKLGLIPRPITVRDIVWKWTPGS